MQYDPENRLINTGWTSNTQYAYDAQNKRIWAATWDSTLTYYTSETYYFYSPQGKLMAQFTPQYQSQTGTLAFQNGAARSYFGGRLLGSEDRLGSRGKYFPYGEDRSNPPPANDQVKFATYTRDSATGLDYADQRYYASTYGRFMSPDPYMASGSPVAPQSWNRYAYALGDPIMYTDRKGLEVDCTDDCDSSDDCDPGIDFCITHTESGGGGDGGGDGGGAGGGETCDYNPYQANCSADDFQEIIFGNVPKRTMAVSASIMKMELKGAMDLAKKMLAEASCAGLFGLTGAAGNTSPAALTVLNQIANSFSFGDIADRVNGNATMITSANNHRRRILHYFARE